MNIQVTQEDIWNGKRGCGRKCAVALAVRRELLKQGMDLHPYIESCGAIWLYNDYPLVVFCPTKDHDFVLEITEDGGLADVQAFIYDFDEASTTHPINFNATIRINKWAKYYMRHYTL